MGGDTLSEGDKDSDIAGPGNDGDEPGNDADEPGWLDDMPDASKAADGEKLGPPGVIPLTRK